MLPGARERQRPICFVKQKALADGPLLEAKSERLQRRHPSSICSFFSSSVFIRRFISFGSSSLLLLSCCSRNALLLLFGGGANVLCVLHSVYGLATRDEPARRPIPFTVYRKKEKKRSGCESVASFTYITHVHHMCNKKARLGIYEYSKKKNRRQLEQRFQTFEYST